MYFGARGGLPFQHFKMYCGQFGVLEVEFYTQGLRYTFALPCILRFGSHNNENIEVPTVLIFKLN